MRRGLLLGGMVLILGLAGCAKAPSEVQQCGSENYGHGDGYDGGARECLWQAYRSKEPAQFTTTKLTIEGDPIVMSVSVLSSGRLEAVIDTTEDAFGDQKITTYQCEAMGEEMASPRPAKGSLRFFRLTNCTGGESKELLI